MTQLVRNQPPHKNDEACSDRMTTAERELAAFFTAVTDLFGAEQARLAAKDWMRELMATHDLPASTRQWRLLTVKASALLAGRVNGSIPLRTLELAS